MEESILIKDTKTPSALEIRKILADKKKEESDFYESLRINLKKYYKNYLCDIVNQEYIKSQALLGKTKVSYPVLDICNVDKKLLKIDDANLILPNINFENVFWIHDCFPIYDHNRSTRSWYSNLLFSEIKLANEKLKFNGETITSAINKFFSNDAKSINDFCVKMFEELVHDEMKNKFYDFDVITTIHKQYVYNHRGIGGNERKLYCVELKW